MQEEGVIEFQVPAPFLELFKPSKSWRHLVFHGGRSSGKSTQVATSRLISGGERRERGLCTREFQNSISESVHQLFRDLIEKYQFTDWEVQKEIIRNVKTGSEIYFKGLHNNSQTIKSFEGVDWCWVEEAQSVSMESIDTLVPTIRKKGSFLIWTMNRLTENDPVWERIASKPDERTYVAKVNSDAIEELLSDEIIHEREKMRKDNPELFEHVWLGEPLTANTGSVFGKQLALAREQGRIGKVPYDGGGGVYTAWDLGIGDSTAIWFFQVVGQEIHYIDYYESSGEDLGHYIAYIQNKPWAGNYAKHFIPHDSRQRELQTGKTRVDFFQDHGIYNIEVLRATNFTPGQDDIDLVARPKFSLCWFDEEGCQRGLECLRAYHYDYDERNKLLRSKPKHDWSSHAASAFIYSLIANTESVMPQSKIRIKTYTPKAFRKDNNKYY